MAAPSSTASKRESLIPNPEMALGTKSHFFRGYAPATGQPSHGSRIHGDIKRKRSSLDQAKHGEKFQTQVAQRQGATLLCSVRELLVDFLLEGEAQSLAFDLRTVLGASSLWSYLLAEGGQHINLMEHPESLKPGRSCK